MSQEYTPVLWVDETPNQIGTIINKERLDQMQTAHHFADGFEEVDAVPTTDPGVNYHKVVFCTADTTFYRWNGTQWVKDVDDSTLALLEAHEADHSNPHVVTKAQVGLGNCDNTSDANKPVSTAQQTALDAKLDDTQLITSWGAGDASATDSNIPSAKLTKDTLDTINTAVAGINAKIPSQASASNQLADKDFVNSSIATNTANFLGTYDAETDLGFTSAQVDAFTDPPGSTIEGDVGTAIANKLTALSKTATNNDYVFVSVDKSTTIDTDWYWRFKYNGTAWVYEFTLNHSSFTSAQWLAINSRITNTLVSEYSDHVADTNNPHGVTKAQVGLGNVDNKSTVSAWQATPDDNHIPTEKLVKDTIDAVTTSAVEQAYPIGSIYMNASNSTNPASLLGFGTWQELAPGRVLMGAGNSSYQAGQEYGEYTHTLTTTEMPSHGHAVSVNGTNTDHTHGIGDDGGNHYHDAITGEGGTHRHWNIYNTNRDGGWVLYHGVGRPDGGTDVGYGTDMLYLMAGWPGDSYETRFATDEQGYHTHWLRTGTASANHNHGGATGGMSANATHGHSVNQSNAGGGGAHNNIQPSLVVYMWVRTA